MHGEFLNIHSHIIPELGATSQTPIVGGTSVGNGVYYVPTEMYLYTELVNISFLDPQVA